MLTTLPLKKTPTALLLLLPRLPLRHPPLHLLRLLHLPHPLPLVLFLSTLPCRAPSWTSRSRQALLLRLAMLLMILEAMKMENEISAPQDGTIASIDVRKGDTVNSGDVLYTMG